MKKPKLYALIIAYWFPPASNQTWRSYHFFRALQSYFDEVKVISTSNRSFLPVKDYQDSAKFVIKAFTLDHRLFTYFNRKETKHVEERLKPKWAFKIYNIFNSFPFNILIGEGGLVYTISGFFKGLKLLKKNTPTLLYSTYRPYSDHVIAYLLKIFRPKCVWVADFRDLHLDPRLNEIVMPKFQKWCNRKILGRADIVTTVSKGLAIHLESIHSNVVVLRNGIEANYEQSTQQKPDIVQKPHEHFTITYTGSMFRNLRKPDLLLEALQSLAKEEKLDLKKLMIVYAGKDKATWEPLIAKYGLVDSFKPFGNVSYEVSLELQATSHINLLLTYASPELKGNATGKLYEYLAARRTILLLVNGCVDEELEEIFEETNAGLIAYESLNHLNLVKEFIYEKYNEWVKTGHVAPVIQAEKLKNYRWDYMMKEFLDKYYFNQLAEDA